jgi:hypothetical protein
LDRARDIQCRTRLSKNVVGTIQEHYADVKAADCWN